MKTLGQRIRELREEGDLSLRELGKRLSVSAAFLSDIELGRRYPSDKVLTKMAQILGTSKEDLKMYDHRPPVQELKRLSEADPMYGIAFRKMIDKKISAEDLIAFVDKETKGRKGKCIEQHQGLSQKNLITQQRISSRYALMNCIKPN